MKRYGAVEKDPRANALPLGEVIRGVKLNKTYCGALDEKGNDRSTFPMMQSVSKRR